MRDRQHSRLLLQWNAGRRRPRCNRCNRRLLACRFFSSRLLARRGGALTQPVGPGTRQIEFSRALFEVARPLRDLLLEFAGLMPKVFDLPLHGFARSLLLGGGRISQRDLPFLILQLRDSGRLRAALLLQCFKRLPFSGSFCPCRHEIGSDLFKFVRALRNLSLQVIELSLQRVVRGCQMVGFRHGSS